MKIIFIFNNINNILHYKNLLFISNKYNIFVAFHRNL